METITEDYVSFEVAKLLKEKGFDELCIFKYDCEGIRMKAGVAIDEWQNSELDENEYSAPTHQRVMKWLREVLNIIISIAPQKDKYYFTPWQHWDSEWVHTKAMLPLYDTYEQACEAAIKYCLENLI